jgi:RNA 2',3'-cyclic 3'-phosphodiesterase
MKVIPNSAWRIFCAIELPEPTRNLVLAHIVHLKAAVPDARASWSRDSNLHLTIKFLGEIPRATVANISQAAARTVVGLGPFSFRLEHAGAFPDHGRPRVLWLGIEDDSGKLKELHTHLENEAAMAGFPKDERPFQPHLTVARLRRPQRAQELAAAHLESQFEPVEIPVSELLVIRSELSSAGSKYTVVSRHLLEAHASSPQ